MNTKIIGGAGTVIDPWLLVTAFALYLIAFGASVLAISGGMVVA